MIPVPSHDLWAQVTHLRPPLLSGGVPGRVLLSTYDMKVKGLKPHPKGGMTIVVLWDSNGEYVAAGEAGCSDLDTYDRRKGRMIAMGRALCEATGEMQRRRERRK